MKTRKHVAIVGGGLAGMAAALMLNKAGLLVSIFEASPNLGGRTRAVEFGDQQVDNGQHIMVGAYQAMLFFYRLMRLKFHKYFACYPLELLMSTPDAVQCHLKASLLPRPFNWLQQAFNHASKFPQYSKHIHRFMIYALKYYPQNMTVADWYEDSKQPQIVRDIFLDPLCLAALSTPANIASANIFQKVLVQTFYKKSFNATWLIPKHDLTQTFVTPFIKFSEQTKIFINTNTRIKTILQDANKVGLIIDDCTQYFDDIILATPVHATKSLLEPLTKCNQIVNDLEQFKFTPITTLYLKYPKNVTLPLPIIGMLKGEAQWAFSRNYSNSPNIISIIKTGELNHSKQQFREQTIKNLHKMYKHLAKPIESKIITEKRAAFQATPSIIPLRPDSATPIQSLHLAGAYTNTPYPASIESAILSGYNAAHKVIKRK